MHFMVIFGFLHISLIIKFSGVDAAFETLSFSLSGGLGRSMEYLWQGENLHTDCMGVAATQPTLTLEPACFLSEDPDYVYDVSLTVKHWYIYILCKRQDNLFVEAGLESH